MSRVCKILRAVCAKRVEVGWGRQRFFISIVFFWLSKYLVGSVLREIKTCENCWTSRRLQV